MTRAATRRVSGALALALAFHFAFPEAGAQVPGTPAPREERVEDLPAGAGRDETFGLCAACHAYRLVSNQGMTREKWDDTLHWMSERHNMPVLEGADRDLILDYLAQAHPPKAAPALGGFRNPFAPQ